LIEAYLIQGWEGYFETLNIFEMVDPGKYRRAFGEKKGTEEKGNWNAILRRTSM
jgi:hypothetical protein